MTDFIWSNPIANRRHRCSVCWRTILPTENYYRMAGLDGGYAWTHKECAHCHRVAGAYCRDTGDTEYEDDCVVDWLAETAPTIWGSLRAGWRYPDGELLPLPFQPRCHGCRTPIRDNQLWCPPCDQKRIDRITQGFNEIKTALTEAAK